MELNCTFQQFFICVFLSPKAVSPLEKIRDIRELILPIDWAMNILQRQVQLIKSEAFDSP